MAAKRTKEQGDKLKNLTPKEREEHKKFQGRLSGTIISCSLPTLQLKHFQANKYSSAVETGPKTNRLKKMEFLLMSPNMSALAKWMRKMRRIASTSVIVIEEKGHMDGC